MNTNYNTWVTCSYVHNKSVFSLAIESCNKISVRDFHVVDIDHSNLLTGETANFLNLINFHWERQSSGGKIGKKRLQHRFCENLKF